MPESDHAHTETYRPRFIDIIPADCGHDVSKLHWVPTAIVARLLNNHHESVKGAINGNFGANNRTSLVWIAYLALCPANTGSTNCEDSSGWALIGTERHSRKHGCV